MRWVCRLEDRGREVRYVCCCWNSDDGHGGSCANAGTQIMTARKLNRVPALRT